MASSIFGSSSRIAARAAPRTFTGRASRQNKRSLNDLTEISSRHMSSVNLQPFGGKNRPVDLQNKRIVVVAGASGDLGKQIVQHTCQDADTHVIATTRKSDHRGLHDGPNVSWCTLPVDFSHQEAFWNGVFYTVAQGKPTKVKTINAMGGSHPTEGQTLFDANTRNAQVLFDSFANAPIKASEKTVVQLSSIAANMSIKSSDQEKDLDPFNEYGRTKALATQSILRIPSTKLPNVKILQVGYVLPIKVEGAKEVTLFSEHAYDPSQMASLPRQLIFGDGSQQMYVIAMDDLIKGIEKCDSTKGREVIPAFGHFVTQLELFEFFTKLIGKPFNPLFINISGENGEQVLRLAQETAKGHWATYAIFYAKNGLEGGRTLCPKPFKELLGRTPKTMEEYYSFDPSKELVLKKPPIEQHFKEIAKKVRGDPKSGLVIVSTAAGIATQLAKKDPAGLLDVVKVGAKAAKKVFTDSIK